MSRVHIQSQSNRQGGRTTFVPVTMRIAKNRVALLSKAEREAIMGPTLAALDMMRESIATAHEWAILAEACGVGLTLTEVGICTDQQSVETLTAGYVALGEIANRFPDTGHHAPRPHELQAIEAAIELHAVQLLVSTVEDLRKAIKRRENLKALARDGRLKRITFQGAQP